MDTTVVDAFCGIGGLALGWMNISGRPVCHVGALDCDKSLSSCYRRNFPNTPFFRHRFGNPFSAVMKSDLVAILDRITKPVDVLLAAPPCKPFSAAGKRKLGMDAYLGFHVCALAEHLRPRIIVMENVPQFSRANGGMLLGRLRVRFLKAGYATVVVTLDALNFGLPQRRVRTLLLALRSRTAQTRLESVVKKLQSEQRQRSADQPVTVSDAIGDLPALEAGCGADKIRITVPPRTDYQKILRQSSSITYNHIAVNHSREMIARIRTVRPGETPQNNSEHPLRPKRYFRLAYARLSGDAPAGTLTTNTHNPGSGRFLHYRDDRTLTVREVARLQGFPDWFRFVGRQTDQRRHVGNAVPPPLSQRIAETFTEVGV